MSAAFIGGRAAPLDDAIAEAARLLARSRAAVLAGMATDAAGGAAAIALARRIGAAIDHSHADAALRDLDVMRRAGWIVTTVAQARARADTVLLAGPGLDRAWPRLADDLRLDRPPPLFPEQPRQVLRLCPGRGAPAPGRGAAGPAAVAAPGNAGSTVLTIGEDPSDLPVMLGVLRALLGARPVRPDAPLLQGLREGATLLASARFGVAIWSAAAIDPLSIEMLCGLIDDLNARTRFAGLPVPPPGNASGLVQVVAAATGYPLRVGFARSRPEHDPWRFDAVRMIECGEADSAVWISAFTPEPPPWRRRVPLVALVAAGTEFPAPPEVAFTVGCPGVDHAAVLFDASLGGLACKSAQRAATPTPSVATILQRIDRALRDAPPAPC